MSEYTSLQSADSFTSAISIGDKNRNTTPLGHAWSAPLFGGMQNLFLAVAALTAPHIPVVEASNLSQSVSSAVVWGIPRKGRKISLREARQIALRILAETERELQEERSAEARFLLGSWEEHHIES